MDLTETAVRQWVKRTDLMPAEAAMASHPPNVRSCVGCVSEHRTLREEREILPKAAVFFTKETDYW